MLSVKNPIIRSVLLQLAQPDGTHAAKWCISPDHIFNIRPLQLDDDLPVIFEWVNQTYAIPFWQMNGPFSFLENTYKTIKDSPFADSLIGCFDGEPICQVDIYDPFDDQVGKYYSTQPGDLGFHLLTAPGKKPLPNGTAKIVRLFLDLFFRCPVIQRIIGEPDEKNEKANQLLNQLRFEYTGKLQMKHKTANFYILTRERYEQQTLHIPL